MPFNVTMESTLARDYGIAMQLVVAGIKGAVSNACEEGAAEARSTHKYKDRTGNLTRSIGDRLINIEAYGAEGVIEATADYASYVEHGTKPHVIPKGGAQKGVLLAWEGDGGSGDWHFAREVHHPGQRTPLPFMGAAYLKAERVLERDIEVAVQKAQEAFK
jgi:hypothetical protein